MLFKTIVLTAQHKMQKERSISAVYHLIQGKQSIQTIQDANLFQLNHFYGIYKKLSKERFFDFIIELQKEQYIQKKEIENYYELTVKAEHWLQQNNLQQNHLYLNGKAFKQIDHIYEFRLLLLIQVWTNSKKRHFTFIPIIENKEVERWVKIYYHKTKDYVDDYLQRIHKELQTILSLLPTYQAELFVSQLTGYKTIGLTTEQIMNKFHMCKEDVYLLNVNVIHFILLEVKERKSTYPQLSAISDGLFVDNRLTESAEITKRLLRSGHSINQIITSRRLKKNTIYDHIVEIALHDDHFPIDEYIDKLSEREIVKAVDTLQSYKLRDIKAIVSDDITYFQIRLVLARLTN